MLCTMIEYVYRLLDLQAKDYKVASSSQAVTPSISRNNSPTRVRSAVSQKVAEKDCSLLYGSELVMKSLQAG